METDVEPMTAEPTSAAPSRCRSRRPTSCASCRTATRSCWSTAIVELEPGVRAVGIKNVTANEPQFTGHFPGRPIMPGVLMVEALAQTAGVAVLTLDEYRGKLGLFAGIDDCRFRRLVQPGDTLRLEVTVEKLRGMFGRVRAVASVDGEVAVEGTLSIIIPRDQSMTGDITGG